MNEVMWGLTLTGVVWLRERAKRATRNAKQRALETSVGARLDEHEPRGARLAG